MVDATSSGEAKWAQLCSGGGYSFSRSCAARIPAPKRPLPRMPMTVTMVTTCRIAPPCSA